MQHLISVGSTINARDAVYLQDFEFILTVKIETEDRFCPTEYF